MVATVVTAAASTMMLGSKSTTTPPKLTPAISTKPSPTFLSLQTPPKYLPITPRPPPALPSLTSSAIAAAVFSSLSSADAAFAVQQIADIADGDSRGIALLIPIVPAIGWVLYNIFQPAVNQINKMRSVKGIAIGLGFGLSLASAHSASAGEVAAIAEAVSGDNRGLLLLVPVAVAIGWVLFNILKPALNQLDKMRKQRFTPGTYHKLQQRKFGPFRVQKRIGENAYLLELPIEFGTSPIFNVADLTPFYGDPPSTSSDLSTTAPEVSPDPATTSFCEISTGSSSFNSGGIDASFGAS